jgi:hypothetical protein
VVVIFRFCPWELCPRSSRRWQQHRIPLWTTIRNAISWDIIGHLSHVVSLHS